MYTEPDWNTQLLREPQSSSKFKAFFSAKTLVLFGCACVLLSCSLWKVTPLQQEIQVGNPKVGDLVTFKADNSVGEVEHFSAQKYVVLVPPKTKKTGVKPDEIQEVAYQFQVGDIVRLARLTGTSESFNGQQGKVTKITPNADDWNGFQITDATSGNTGTWPQINLDLITKAADVPVVPVVAAPPSKFWVGYLVWKDMNDVFVSMGLTYKAKEKFYEFPATWTGPDKPHHISTEHAGSSFHFTWQAAGEPSEHLYCVMIFRKIGTANPTLDTLKTGFKYYDKKFIDVHKETKEIQKTVLSGFLPDMIKKFNTALAATGVDAKVVRAADMKECDTRSEAISSISGHKKQS